MDNSQQRKLDGTNLKRIKIIDGNEEKLDLRIKHGLSLEEKEKKKSTRSKKTKDKEDF